MSEKTFGKRGAVVQPSAGRERSGSKKSPFTFAILLQRAAILALLVCCVPILVKLFMPGGANNSNELVLYNDLSELQTVDLIRSGVPSKLPDDVPPPHAQSGLTAYQNYVWKMMPCGVVGFTLHQRDGGDAGFVDCWIKINFADVSHVEVAEIVRWKVQATLERNKADLWRIVSMHEDSKAVMTTRPQ